MQVIKSELKTLINSKTLEPVRMGETIQCSRGESYTITGGRAPHKPSSTGRVWVKEVSQEYFPTVFGLEWV